MMQMRDWVIGLIGLIFGAIGLLSLLGFLPFELSRSTLLWIASIAGLILFYSSIVEITNSNVVGTVSIIVALVVVIISFLPLLNSLGVFGSWAEFKWIGDIVYKIILVIEGAFLIIATFAMEL